MFCDNDKLLQEHLIGNTDLKLPLSSFFSDGIFFLINNSNFPSLFNEKKSYAPCINRGNKALKTIKISKNLSSRCIFRKN